VRLIIVGPRRTRACAGGLVALALVATLVACEGAPAPGSTAAPTARPARPASVGPEENLAAAPTVLAGAASLSLTPVASPPPAVDQARATIARTATATEQSELLNLLHAAESAPDEGQRYQAFLGSWQYMRLIYLQRGERPEQKAALDAIEAIARTFPQYRAEHFRLQKAIKA